MDVPEFKRSVRGYDSVEVDAVINDLTNRLSQMESDQAESARLIQRLNRELTEAKRNKPSFAELGSAFEETLRLAEDQSAKMVQDAINESQTLLNQARNEVKALRDKAERDARQLVSRSSATSPRNVSASPTNERRSNPSGPALNVPRRRWSARRKSRSRTLAPRHTATSKNSSAKRTKLSVSLTR